MGTMSYDFLAALLSSYQQRRTFSFQLQLKGENKNSNLYLPAGMIPSFMDKGLTVTSGLSTSIPVSRC